MWKGFRCGGAEGEPRQELYGWGVRGEGDRRQCGGCKRWVSRANYARHVRACGRVEDEGAVGGRDVGVGIRRGERLGWWLVGFVGGKWGRATWPGTRGGRAECGTREKGGKPLTLVDGPVDGWIPILLPDEGTYLVSIWIGFDITLIKQASSLWSL